jgi:MFS family permease
MIWVDLIRTLMVGLIPLLYALHALNLERLYVLVFLTAIFSAVFGPALASSVPLIVPRTHLIGANALLQTTTTIGVLVGPAVSGLGIALIGAQNVLFVNAGTFLISVLCLLPIRIREIKLASGGPTKHTSIITELLAGFRFVFLANPTVFALMVTTALYTVGMSAFVFLLPVMAKKVLHIGPVELGWLWSALGVGMLISAVGLTWIRQTIMPVRFRIVAGTLAIGGLAVCGLGFLRSAVYSVALLLLIGSSTAVFMPLVWGVLQELTPAPMLGRVFTMFSTAGMATAMAGMTIFGWVADAVSPGASLLGVGGVLVGAACVAGYYSYRTIPAQPVPLHASPPLRSYAVQSAASRT